MKLKSKLALLVSGLSLSFSVFSFSSQPDTCPSAGAIKSEGLSMIIDLQSQAYSGFNYSHYGTNENWLFAIGVLYGDNEEEAYSSGIKLLSTLSGKPVPEEVEPDIWACIYELPNNPNEVAVALRTDLPFPHTMKHLLMKKRG